MNNRFFLFFLVFSLSSLSLNARSATYGLPYSNTNVQCGAPGVFCGGKGPPPVVTYAPTYSCDAPSACDPNNIPPLPDSGGFVDFNAAPPDSGTVYCGTVGGAGCQ